VCCSVKFFASFFFEVFKEQEKNMPFSNGEMGHKNTGIEFFHLYAGPWLLTELFHHQIAIR